MTKNWVQKIIVLGIVILFFGTSIRYSVQSHSLVQHNEVIICNDLIQTTSDPHYYAVITACSQYKDPSHNLPKQWLPPFSDETLSVFYTSLLQSNNWGKDNIILLLNEDATKQNITAALEYMASIVGPEDYFLFSWSGHGTIVPDVDGDETQRDSQDTMDESICPYDIEEVNDIWVNAFTDDELGSYFSAISCKGMTLIFDCCLSGGMINRTTRDIRNGIRPCISTSFISDFQQDLQDPRMTDVNGDGRVVIMSTHEDLLSRGIYLTGFALTAAMALASSHPDKSDQNNDGIISTEECFRYAKPLVYLQSSLIWLELFILLSGAAIMDQVPMPFAVGMLMTIYEFFLIQTIMLLLNRHFCVNLPIMQDDYPGELPLIVL